MACYTIVLLVFLILRKSNPLWLNIPILFFIIDAFVPEGLMYRYLGSNSELNLLPMAFALGAFCAVNATKIKINNWVLIVSVIVFFFFRNAPKANIFLIITSNIFILYLSTLKFFLKLQPKHDISYGIYVWGFLVQQTIFFYFGKLNIVLHIVIATIISFGLSYITYLYVEKPNMKKGKNIFKYYNQKMNTSII